MGLLGKNENEGALWGQGGKSERGKGQHRQKAVIFQCIYESGYPMAHLRAPLAALPEQQAKLAVPTRP